LIEKEGPVKKWNDGDPVLRAGDANGDWNCPKCGNVNWAKRSHCNVCKASKNDLVENTVRAGAAGGFKEVDEEEERRKKRRREEEDRDTKRRKEEKKRCKSCKRYKCVC